MGSSVESFYEKITFFSIGKESKEDVPVVLTNFGDLRTYFSLKIEAMQRIIRLLEQRECERKISARL